MRALGYFETTTSPMAVRFLGKAGEPRAASALMEMIPEAGDMDLTRAASKAWRGAEFPDAPLVPKMHTSQPARITRLGVTRILARMETSDGPSSFREGYPTLIDHLSTELTQLRSSGRETSPLSMGPGLGNLKARNSRYFMTS